MEDFVNFKLAQKLKEKGFSLEKTEIYGIFDSDGLFHSQLYFNYIETMDCDEIIAPTISQVLKWLRKEKKIHITANIYQDESEDADGRIVDKWRFWNWNIQSCISGNFLQEEDGVEYESYESAIFAGIEYATNNLI